MKLTFTKVVAALVCLVAPSAAAEFKSEKECVVGAKVTDRQNRTGKIYALDGPTCRVQLDGNGEKVPYLFWMLRAAGGRAETTDKLVVGPYECWVGTQAAAGIRITSPTSYVFDGQSGKLHVEASKRIVFESGPLVRFNAKLLPGPRIGLNLDSGSYYNMACDPAK